jgi:proteasome lid subunit RPN8/RPN11
VVLLDAALKKCIFTAEDAEEDGRIQKAEFSFVDSVISSMFALKKSDLQAIIAHCNEGYPDEACGILAGKGGRVEKVYPMRNSRPSPVGYEMEPEEQFRVLREIRQAGLDLVGIFHSHPGSPAYPSNIDVERAYWPGTLFPNYPKAVYVIVSLVDREQPVVKSYSISEGSVREIPLTE